LEFGKCYSRTCRILGYPSHELLTQWVKEMAQQPRKFKRNGLKLTQKKKKLLFLPDLPVVIQLHRILLMKSELFENPFTITKDQGIFLENSQTEKKQS